MDFKGQKLAETLSMYIITAFAVIAFLVGYLQQDFGSMMKLFTGGVALAFMATVPDWGVYNKHPVQFMPPKEQAAQKRGGSGAGGSGVAAQRKKKQASWSSFWGMF